MFNEHLLTERTKDCIKLRDSGWEWSGRVVLRTVQALSQEAEGALVTISLSVDICHGWPLWWAVKATFLPQAEQRQKPRCGRLSTLGSHWAPVSCLNP